MSTAAIDKLVTKKQKAKTNVDGTIVLVYGDKKVGKSTWASRADKPLFLDCEQGLRTVADEDGNVPDHISIDSWQKMVEVTKQLLKDHGDYETIVVDGMGELTSYLIEDTLRTNNALHMNDGVLGYGNGKNLILREFRYWFQQLRRLDCTIILTAHDRLSDAENNGVKFDKRIPLFDATKLGVEVWDAVKPAINMVLYANKVHTKDGVQHQMTAKGTQALEAGSPFAQLPDVMLFDYDQLRKALK